MWTKTLLGLGVALTAYALSSNTAFAQTVVDPRTTNPAQARQPGIVIRKAIPIVAVISEGFRTEYRASSTWGNAEGFIRHGLTPALKMAARKIRRDINLVRVVNLNSHDPNEVQYSPSDIGGKLKGPEGGLLVVFMSDEDTFIVTNPVFGVGCQYLYINAAEAPEIGGVEDEPMDLTITAMVMNEISLSGLLK